MKKKPAKLWHVYILNRATGSYEMSPITQTRRAAFKRAAALNRAADCDTYAIPDKPSKRQS